MITLGTLDRTIFELIRKKIVSLGYLPDFSNIAGTTILDKKNNYEVAKQAIIANGKQLIEVFSVGSAESKGVKSYSTISISRKNIYFGEIGTANISVYTPSNNNYLRSSVPEKTIDIEYEIRVITDTTSYERIMQQAVLSVLGLTRTHKTIDINWDFLGEPFYLEYRGSINLSDSNFIEHLITYRVKDVLLDVQESSPEPIAALREIEIDITDLDNNDSLSNEIIL